jgi:(2R)-sulfolactate sulfo-lyase subunit alpha
MSIDFLVHEAADGVGVVVVEGIKADQELTGWVMKEDQTLKVKVNNDIPIGHKLALKDLAVGETILKYNTDIGKMVVAAKKGDHVHVHNLKTKRW